MKGGVILFRGTGAAARRYVEADRSRADEYYLGADDAVAKYAVLDGMGEVTAERIEAKNVEREHKQREAAGRERQLSDPFEYDPYRHDTGREGPTRGQ